MIIRVLPHLESRADWIAFCRREAPYCLVDTPACLVDFQTHFLQLTLFGQNGPVRYTLGSRRTIDPAWQLIKRCNWSLSTLVAGLDTLDFGGNVRDNELLGVHTEMSARRSTPRDPHLHAPDCSEVLTPLRHLPAQWDSRNLKRLLANQQYRDWRSEQEGINLTPAALLLDLLAHAEDWSARPSGPRLLINCRRQPLISLIPDLSPPSRSVDQGQPLLAAPLR